ncbi:MAG: MBL fold metallo-hydrolase [Chitinivibrionales bacterium]|nr:MBL fold metallo-hydrolase [Chitinivibrionales bacterium]
MAFPLPADSMTIHLQVFGSTSSGNCTTVWNERGAVMVDCGLGVRYTTRCLDAVGLDWSQIDGVLLTHTHRDHANTYTLQCMLRHGVKLMGHVDTLSSFLREHPVAAALDRAGLLVPFNGASLVVGPFEVASFAVPHDAPGGSHGYALRHEQAGNGATVAVATDLGQADGELALHFRDADAIVLESNHDVGMLRASRRPPWLQKRIRGAHLSNDESASFLAEAIGISRKAPGAIALAHISRECNTNALAHQCTAGRLAELGADECEIVATHKSRPSKIITVG